MVYPGQTGIAVMGASTWGTSISGTSSQFVKGDGTLDSGAYVTSHNILSATHLDTLADTVARGDVLIGNATPKWSRLPFPATPTGKILQATATDVAWSTNALTIGVSASVSGSNTGDQTLPTDATIVTTDVTTNNASTTKHGWLLKATAPAANVLNVVGIANGETVYSDKTLFDGTTPATMTSGGSGAAGTSLVAAHRDHTHPFTNPAIDTLAAGTDITTLNASTTAHGLVVKAVAPAANTLNVVGIANGETAYTDKLVLDAATTPSTQAFADAAAIGTSLVAAHADHKHAMMASPKDTTAQTGILKGNGSTISAVTAPTGTIVGTSDSQALSNKTYEGYSINATPTANNILVADANHFLPDTGLSTSVVRAVAGGYKIATGWGSVNGNSTKFVTGSISFGVTFATAPNVIISIIGSLGSAGTSPASFTAGFQDAIHWGTIGLNSITVTGANFELHNEFSSASGTYVGFSWIAIGT
jgi:hypothetical protein